MTTSADLKTNLTFDDQVIKKIAGITANQVDGIVSLDGNVFSELTDRITDGLIQQRAFKPMLVNIKFQLKWMPLSPMVRILVRFLT
jgi:Uncharacterized protein conserved in bacteria